MEKITFIIQVAPGTQVSIVLLTKPEPPRCGGEERRRGGGERSRVPTSPKAIIQTFEYVKVTDISTVLVRDVWIAPLLG